MYKTIIVTLDRSPLAEQALAHAVAMAKAFHSTIHLLSVVPVSDIQATYTSGTGIDWNLEVGVYEEYLAGIVSRIQEEGVKVISELRRGEVTEEILHYADKIHADMIVMSTHGRSGLGRWVYGSVADRVLRHSPVPVLLVRATEQ